MIKRNKETGKFKILFLAFYFFKNFSYFDPFE